MPSPGALLAAVQRRLGDHRVALLGDTNVDIVLDVPGLPAAGGDALATSQSVGVGGSVTNTAILMRRLGVGVLLTTCVGDDPWSAVAREALAGEGIEATHVRSVSDASTSLNVVAVTPDGERTMFACRGASARLTAADVPEAAIAASDWLHLSGYALLEDPQRSAALRALHVAQESGVPTSLDLPVGPSASARDVVLEAAQRLHLLILGEPEAAELLRDSEAASARAFSIGALRRLGPTVVALKLGSDGALLADNESVVEVPSVAVKALDTTGAGDAFSAGLVAGLTAGLSLAEAGALASICGAAAVTLRGAGRNMPRLEDLHRLQTPVMTSSSRL